MTEERIQKIIAEFGVCSRRKAELLIEKKLVRCNGKIVKLGQKASLCDDITISGKKLEIGSKRSFKYVMLNKPRGYLCASCDGYGRKCVVDLVSGFKERLFSVGRLDLDSEGLLILTNDGDMANKIMHPSSNLEKTYIVTLNGVLTSDQIKQISCGVYLDGVKTSKAKVKTVFAGDNRSVVNISIHEGKKRQIRRMIALFGFEVEKLKRISIGPLKLGTLKTGCFRELSVKELKILEESLKRRIY